MKVLKPWLVYTVVFVSVWIFYTIGNSFAADPDWRIGVSANLNFGKVAKPASGWGYIELNYTHAYTVSGVTFISGTTRSFAARLRDMNNTGLEAHIFVDTDQGNFNGDPTGMYASDWYMRYDNVTMPSMDEYKLVNPTSVGKGLFVWCRVNIDDTAVEGTYSYPAFSLTLEASS